MASNQTVAIIGAGMSGLVAARLLCAGGVAVKLFEANSKVGGCCATTCLEGYTFNDGAIYLAMPEMLDHLFEILDLDRNRLLPLRRISPIQSTRLPDGTIVDIGSGMEVTITSAQDAAAATTRLQAEIADFLRKWEPMRRFFADDIMIHPLSLSHVLTRGWQHLAKLRGTVASHLNNSFSSEAARAALGSTLLYTGISPDRLPAFSLLALVSMLRDGCFLPEGGMGRISEVLNDAVRVLGGNVSLNSTVQRILVKSGRAYAIEVENKGVIEVDAVISSISAMHTYGLLLSRCDVPQSVIRKVQQAPLSHRGFVLQLGLTNRIAARSHTHCVIPWLDELSQVFQQSGGKLRWPIYTVPTVTLPELAPNGCSIIEMFPSINQGIVPSDWNDARKEEVAAQAMSLLRRDHQIDIAVSRILSPKEFQNDAHLYAGALYGLSPVVSPLALFKHRTPIRGLYQTGQTTWPGFGVVGAGMSGVFAAEMLIRDESF